MNEAEKARRANERNRIKQEIEAQAKAKLTEFAKAAMDHAIENHMKTRYAFTATDDTNLNKHLDAVLSAFKSGEISHAKAHGLLANLVMLGINGHSDHAARFVAIEPEEHFKAN